ncbi:MAG: glycerate kinase [Thermoplasmata archaeon]
MITVKNRTEILDHGNKELRSKVLDIIEASINSVIPENLIKKYVSLFDGTIKIGNLKMREIKRVIIIGAGKATYNMAYALEQILGDRIDKGAINVPYGDYAKLSKIDIFQASHPVLDNNSLKGTAKILDLLKDLNSDDLVICLISGGASSLLELLPENISLTDLQQLNTILLDSGADIMEFNTVRKHVSLVKGGKLAELIQPAKCVSLILSDVPSNDPAMIGSGPTVFDNTTNADAYNILKKYGLIEKVPEAITNYLKKTKISKLKNGKTLNILIGTNYTACKTAAVTAKKMGYKALILSTSMEGESRELGAMIANIANECKQKHIPLKPPCALIIGGETTVNIGKEKGIGGRNLEFVLGALLKLVHDPGIVIASVGTDGIDGTSRFAGSIGDESTIKNAIEIGLNPEKFLTTHDTSSFFEQLKDAIYTGKTNTNVSDLRIIMIT